MKRSRLAAVAVAAATLCGCIGAVWAQPADLPIPAATTTEFPTGVAVAQTAAGAIYVDSQGHTLYGMDMRTLLRWGADPAQYCQNDCADLWEPVLAPRDAKPNIAFPRGSGAQGRAAREELRAKGFHVEPQKTPDWTVIDGPQGPQWVYKAWHMVYTRKGDAPGSTAFDGAGNFTWNTLKYVPPVPQITAPPSVSVVAVDGHYALADTDGRILYTGDCATDCAGWKPLSGGLASRGIGEWTLARAGDAPQWHYRNMPVYVSQLEDPTQVPASGVALRP